MKSYFSAFLCGTVSMVAVTAAVAQPTATLDEVTVTARKQTESLQDVPVAVVAISQATLQKGLANNISSIGELAPQMMIGRSVTGTGAVLTIRGISSAAVDSGLDQSVSMSIDGVSLGRGRIVQSAMFDLQQVEVLQGPQALFFGKNSPAGVISITSANPTSEFEGYVKGGYEFEAKEKFAEGVVSGPISDTLKARLAVRWSDMEGWIKNTAVAMPNPFQPANPFPGPLAGKNSPNGDNIGARLTLLWEPTDDFSANLKVIMNRERLNSNSAYTESFCTGGQTKPVTLGVPMVYADCKLDRRQAENALPAALAVNFPYANGGIPYVKSIVGLGALTLNKEFENFTLTSTTGYYDQMHKGANDGDYSEYIQIYGTEAERYRMFNQEIRLNTKFDGPVNVMVGGYFEKTHRRWDNAPDLLHIFNPVANNYTSTTTHSDNETKNYSIFAQARWKILPSLEMAGGARYSHDSKDSVFVNYTGNPALPALGLLLRPDNLPLAASYSDSNVSPEVTLTWKPDEDQTVYGAYKTGYKSGGISNSALLSIDATSQNVLFGPEKAKGFEVGYKADLLARTLRVDVTAYRYKYSGLQVTSYDPVAFRYSIRNAAEARTTGITGSFQWLATDRLSFNGNVGLNKAVYLSFPGAPCAAGQTVAQGCVAGAQDLGGQRLNRAPKLTYKLGADYSADIAPGWVADFSVSAQHSAAYQTQTEYTEGGIQKAYWLVNASVNIGPDDGRFKVSVIGRNLTNSYYKIVTYTQSFGAPTQFNSFLNRPREVVLQAQYNF